MLALTISVATAQPAHHRNSLAIVIGNAKYEHVTPVPYAHNDARAIADFLVKRLAFRPENVVVMLDASRERLESFFGEHDRADGEMMDRLLDRRLEHRGDLFVFYSGHGAPDPEALKDSERRAFLLPVDVRPNRIAAAAFPMDRLQRKLELMRGHLPEGRSVVLMLDACFSGRTPNPGAQEADASLFQFSRGSFSVQLTEPRTGFVRLVAATGDQVAYWDNEQKLGLFTSLFLKGVSGEADSVDFGDSNGRVEPSELARYLEERVPAEARLRHGRTQRPSMSGLDAFDWTGQRVAMLQRPTVLPRTEERPAPTTKSELEARAEAGDIQAQFEFSRSLSAGDGRTPDPVAAARWMRRAANAGHAEAQKRFGDMLDDGIGVTADPALSYHYYRLSADQGFPPGQNAVGWMLKSGRGVERNDVEAIHWFQKAVRADNSNAAANLGWMMREGRGIAKDEKGAVELFRKAAALGCACGEFELGWSTEKGLGVSADPVQAMIHYRVAADAGHALAMNNIGALYYHGRGVKQDRREALAWFRKAADLGQSLAQANLGVSFRDGDGARKSDAEAISLFRKSAAQGEALGQFFLGWMLEHGRGAPRDRREAIRLYRLAAEQGNASAQNNLGLALVNGAGVTRNVHEGLEWYRRAAANGDLHAMTNLARHKLNGQGTPRNRPEAVELLRTASAGGHQQARALLREIGQR